MRKLKKYEKNITDKMYALTRVKSIFFIIYSFVPLQNIQFFFIDFSRLHKGHYYFINGII